MRRTFVKPTVLLLIFGFTGVRRAFAAYIDPNTGGMLFQLLAVMFGVFSGLILFFSSKIKMAFFRILRMLRGSKPEEATKEPSETIAE